MATYTDMISSPRPPEEVFDYMATFSNVAEWDPTAAEASQTASAAARGSAHGSRATTTEEAASLPALRATCPC